MNVLLWHVHGSWTTALVSGPHRYLVPVVPGRGPAGRGRALTYDWPPNVVELTRRDAADADVDVVIVQRPEELHHVARAWLGGRRLGIDVPAVYVEHNAPQGRVSEMRHPAADRPDVLLVHVTHHNALFWDSGSTPTRVIEHGVVDPGHKYRGELARAVVVVNEPQRRGRVTGTDLLPRLSEAAPIDVFGMETQGFGGQSPGLLGAGDVPQARLHDEMARRRVYLHPVRWTSLGLSLIEAMHLGMPVVALATTEAPEAVPPEAGVVTNRMDVLTDGLRRLVRDPEQAAVMGKAAREAALAKYGLARFLGDWDDVFKEVTTR